MKMKILAVANQKGGVGKSTLAVHLAYAAQEKGLRVLLADFDKQGSMSMTFLDEKPAARSFVASDLFADEMVKAEPVSITNSLSIIHADLALLDVDKAENQVIRRPGVALRQFLDQYDLCVIDTPPLMGIRLMAALAAADFVVTPVSIGLYELHGVADLMQTIHVVRTQGINPRLRHLGILPMKTNNRSTEEQKALADLKKMYGDHIMAEVLPERAAVRKAVSNRRPVWVSTRGESHLKAGQEWRAACEGILNRIGL